MDKGRSSSITKHGFPSTISFVSIVSAPSGILYNAPAPSYLKSGVFITIEPLTYIFFPYSSVIYIETFTEHPLILTTHFTLSIIREHSLGVIFP